MVTEYVTTSTRIHATGLELAADVDRVSQSGTYVDAGSLLNDSSILAIAAGHASPGTEGRAFAQLATTGTATLDDLLDEIRQARRTFDPEVHLHLDLFLIWLCHHSSLEVGEL